MINKNNFDLDKKPSTESVQSSKKISDLYDVRYDLSKLQIMTVDGVLADIDREEGRLLFYQHVPIVTNHNGQEEKKLNRCLVELRMPTTTLLMIYSIINLEINSFEKKQRLIRDSKVKIKAHENSMFG